LETSIDEAAFQPAIEPALQRLLADIRARLVDIIVVYKVDRLTRSLADFATMVELFDAHGVSFVAVTQQFNTTTSMGRLTLNVLLSFAQFEREVTGERIRDKIAASKRKGMWMGGVPPLGYDVRERRLVVDPAEAETVRGIFRRYLTLGSVRRLKGHRPVRSLASCSTTAGSRCMCRAQPKVRGATSTTSRGDWPEARRENAGQRWRVPAPELERVVRAVAQQMLTDRAAIVAAVEAAGIDARHLPSVFTAAQEWSARLRTPTHTAPALAQLSERVALQRDGIEVALTLPFATGEEGTAAVMGLGLTRCVPMRMRRRGVEMRLVLDGTAPPSRVDRPLLAAVARASRWADDLLRAGSHPSARSPGANG